MMSEEKPKSNVCSAVAVVMLSVCHPTAGWTGQEGPPENQLRGIWRQIESSEEHAQGIAKLQAFARQHSQHTDVAALAHLRIAQCLACSGDAAVAIAKVRWLAKAFPEAKMRQYTSMGYAPGGRMAREWRRYVQDHPIYVKHLAWYELARSLWRSERLREALAACDHVLASVPPEGVPDTENKMILRTFRLHHRALQLKTRLLDYMGREHSMREARALLEKLYPRDEWRRVELATEKAWASYLDEWREEEARSKAAELKKIEEIEEKARREREAEAKARAEKLDELKAKDEERRRRYEEWKRRRAAQKAAAKKSDQAAPQPPRPSQSRIVPPPLPQGARPMRTRTRNWNRPPFPSGSVSK
jgi:hypothetical protein